MGGGVPDFESSFFEPTLLDNMNGEYPFSTTPGGTPGLFPKRFADYPGGVEAFDVYSPIMTTLYSQVWWSPLDPVPFPDDVIAKYNNTAMAIVGWEIDQVRRTAEGDVSVPISASYNHHYTAQLIGAGSRFRKVYLEGPDDPLAAEVMEHARQIGGHGHIAFDQPHYLVEALGGDDPMSSSSAGFSSANGGEYRKTYHGFAPSHAVVLESPTAIQITPMQIDTWNRDAMDISGGDKPTVFVPGPLPSSSLAPADASYSGLLECPLTTRISKSVEGTYFAQGQGKVCDLPIATAAECYAAAAAIEATGDKKHTFVNITGSDPARPAGCSAVADASSPLAVEVYFNTLNESAVGCAADVANVAGTSAALVNVTVALNASSAELTLQGPADVWFGVGFGAHAMADLPWTVVVDGKGSVTEHKLGDHEAGSLLAPSVTVVSTEVEAGLRTVVLSRALQGADDQYYTFVMSSDDATIPIIDAVGSGPDFAYHKDKTPTTLTLLPAGEAATGACVCANKIAFGQASGSLVYNQQPETADTGTGAVGFSAGKCQAWPATDILDRENPTCDIRAYVGGQWSCHHMWSLLDAEQEIPWTDQPLEMVHKYRFYVQPYDASYHKNLTLGESAGSALLIGSPWEYDVPKCSEGIEGCSLVDGTWIHTVEGGAMGHHTFTALNFHCHAPTCLSMAVYACAEGTALEDCNATVGKLLCEQRPVHGGGNGTRFDEAGYISIPDCFWGDAEFGLEAPLDLEGVPLHMVKTCNATNGHYGEMAGGQPWVQL